MDDKILIGLVVAILSVSAYLQLWIFVFLLIITAVGAAFQRQRTTKGRKVDGIVNCTDDDEETKKDDHQTKRNDQDGDKCADETQRGSGNDTDTDKLNETKRTVLPEKVIESGKNQAEIDNKDETLCKERKNNHEENEIESEEAPTNGAKNTENLKSTTNGSRPGIPKITYECVLNSSLSATESTSTDNLLHSTLDKYGLEIIYWSGIFQHHLGVTALQQLRYLNKDDFSTLVEYVRYSWEKRALADLLDRHDRSEFKRKPTSEKQITRETTDKTQLKRSNEDILHQTKFRNKEQEYSEDIQWKNAEEQTLSVLNKLGLLMFFPNKLKLKSIIKIRDFDNTDRLADITDIPWVFMRNIIMINWTARDILIERHLEELWGSQDLRTEDWNFESIENDKEEVKDNIETINPLDLIVALWQCCSPNLKQVLSTKMFMCRLAIPFALPLVKNTIPTVDVWPIRQIIIEQKATSGTTQTTAYKCPCNVVSFLRLGRICISKSKLMNQLLSEQYHDTFFNRDCPLGTSKRVISSGLIEAAWHLPREHSENVMLYLNLRGDGLLHDQQLHILSQISSVVVVLLDINLLGNTACKAILQTMYKRVPGVVLGIDAYSISNAEAKSICQQHFKDNSDYRKKIRVCKIAVADTITSFSLIKKEMVKGIIDTASADPVISLSKRLHQSVQNCYEIDENSRIFQQAIKKATEVTQLLQCDCSDLKQKHIPLQGQLWREFSETQKATKQSTMHQAITDEENKKEEMKRLRHKQFQIFQEKRLLMNKFQSNLLNSIESDEECILFITYLKVFLDDISRNVLPDYLNQYQVAWHDLKTGRDHKETKIEALQERLKQAEYHLADASFGYEHLVRECGQIYECIIECDEKDMIPHANNLSKICAQTLLLGYPFEIMDGDAANVPMRWIKAVFRQLRKITGNKKILALSVLGIQSSGKSTLLNTMFGLQFAVSAGRCTRGVFVQLVPVSSKQFKFDYLLVVDTEGLRASELGNQKRDHDNKLATFVIGLGDITLINIKGENTSEITDILQIAVHAFLRLKLVNQKLNLKQKCIFVHQNVPATDASDKMMHGRKKLVDNLDEMTKEAAKQEQITNVQTFDQVIDFDSEKNVWYFSDLWVGDPPMAPTNPGYSKSVRDVKHAILYKLTSQRNSFFTIKDTMIRIEDLWTGILRDDFVYGFRNSLEMKAYSTMEKRYQEVHWDMHKFFYEFIMKKAKTRIEGSSKEEDLETGIRQIRKELKQEAEQTVGVLLENLESFVKTSELRDVMCQWSHQRALKLRLLKEDLLSSSESDIMNIREEKRIQILQITERTKHEVQINERAIQIAKTLKGKKADKKAMEEKFEIMWSDWMKNFSTTFQDVQDEWSVKDKIENLVWERFSSIAGYLKTQQTTCAYETLNCLVGSLCLEDFEIGKHLEIHKQLNLETITNAFGFTHEDFGQYKSNALDITNTTFRRIDVLLVDTSRQDARFNVKSVADILRIIENAVDDHNSFRSQDLRFNLLPPYKALLIQHVVGYITIFFNSQEQEYTRRHSLRGQLEEYRETVWQLFKNVVEKKTEDHITAGFFKQALTKSVIDHVSDMIPLDIQDTMLLKFTHQKYSVIRDILIYLAEKGEFDDCYRYISDPTTFVLEWLTNQMNTLVFDEIVGNSNQYVQFAKKHVQKLFIEIEKAVRSINVENAVKCAPQTANESFLFDDPTDIFNTATVCSPVKKWIVSFTSYLTTMEILPISQYNFSHVTDKSEIDVYSFTQIVLEQLEDMEITVCRHFIKTTGNNIKWKKSPMTRIMDQLWGCTATCPFCY
ncbi:Hypothetical predicted protein [Mytilus galloprovincialis]|uniref:VLIG-type G domain-containing protein n=1 Tax=Mytilus galloprovincialis TaxID=29158 RepID=A0A8B6FHX3_MYTGA|nr:Hypothetical predicted protein [Mytilus galloprovincialis]